MGDTVMIDASSKGSIEERTLALDESKFAYQKQWDVGNRRLEWVKALGLSAFLVSGVGLWLQMAEDTTSRFEAIKKADDDRRKEYQFLSLRPFREKQLEVCYDIVKLASRYVSNNADGKTWEDDRANFQYAYPSALAMLTDPKIGMVLENVNRLLNKYDVDFVHPSDNGANCTNRVGYCLKKGTNDAEGKFRANTLMPAIRDLGQACAGFFESPPPLPK
jgi:hypothetical protein